MKSLLSFALATLASASALAVELIQNGDFSKGLYGADHWIHSNGFAEPSIGFWPEDDPDFTTGSIRLGGTGSDRISHALQFVDFGTESSGWELTFRYRTWTKSMSEGAHHWFVVETLGGFKHMLLELRTPGALSPVYEAKLNLWMLNGAGSSILQFQHNALIDGESYVYIDDVSLHSAPVPEPATFVAVGFALVSFVRRTRKPTT